MGDVYILNGKILSGLPNHAKDIIFDNTGTDMNSTNTEDAIKEVNSNLSANNIHVFVDISSYNSSSNAYTCPYDGIIQIQSKTPALSNVYIAGDDDNFYFSIYSPHSDGNVTRATQLNVKKGMKFYVVATTGVTFNTNTWVRYYPIY